MTDDDFPPPEGEPSDLPTDNGESVSRSHSGEEPNPRWSAKRLEANHGDEEGSSSPGDGGLFDDILNETPIFERKDVLRPSFTPSQLPHREDQVNEMATILASALRGDSPSNMLVYGKPGTGKTASTKFVSQELQQASEDYETPCTIEYINCEVVDTRYRVLARLANKFIKQNRDRVEEELETLRGLDTPVSSAELPEYGVATPEMCGKRIKELHEYEETVEEVPMTGWPTDRVYSHFFCAVDLYPRMVVIMLDEVDKLVEKSGDDTLYNLSRMNNDLNRSKVSLIGISNNLTFTDFLDPRVRSSLGEDEIVFPPYNAEQLGDILSQRADIAFRDEVLVDDVIPLCAAFAAREHGDARKALDLLRTAGELAERSGCDTVEVKHVRAAQEEIELDRIEEAVRTLPTQSKIVLLAVIRLHEETDGSINTGEVYNEYKSLCNRLDVEILTQRRVTDLIGELDMLGMINALVVNRGRFGRTKDISLSVPGEKAKSALVSDGRFQNLE